MKRPFLMDLQLFAEKGEEGTLPQAGGSDAPQQNPPAEEKKEEPPKTYTEEELSKIKEEIQKAHQEELKKATKDGMSEAERLAKLSDKERKEEEHKKLLQELETLRAEKQQSALKEQAVKLLEQEGMGSDFAQMVMGQSEEEIARNVQTLKAAFDKAVSEKVKERLSGSTPQTGNAGNTQNSVQSEFEKALRI